jgi:hypothetical protein
LNHLKIWANDQPSPELVTQAIAKLIRDRTDLRQLESSNITARILNFQSESSRLEIASFVQIRPSKKAAR